MDQSLQQGLAIQTQSIEEELSSPVAICVMVRRRCHRINLGLLQYMCTHNACSVCCTVSALVCVCFRLSDLALVSSPGMLFFYFHTPPLFFLVSGELGTKKQTLKPILLFAILASPPAPIYFLRLFLTLPLNSHSFSSLFLLFLFLSSMSPLLYPQPFIPSASQLKFISAPVTSVCLHN